MAQNPATDQDEARRLLLQAKLTQLAPKAWFKRPQDNLMTYPCFIYRTSRPNILRANNHLYQLFTCWNVIYISRTPDTGIIRTMTEAFKYCDFDREYESDNLYHYSFTLYY